MSWPGRYVPDAAVPRQTPYRRGAGHTVAGFGQCPADMAVSRLIPAMQRATGAPPPAWESCTRRLNPDGLPPPHQRLPGLPGAADDQRRREPVASLPRQYRGQHIPQRHPQQRADRHRRQRHPSPRPGPLSGCLDLLWSIPTVVSPSPGFASIPASRSRTAASVCAISPNVGL